MALSRPVHGFESRRERHEIKHLRVCDFLRTKSVREFLQPFWDQMLPCRGRHAGSGIIIPDPECRFAHRKRDLLQVHDQAAGVVAPANRYHDRTSTVGKLEPVLATDRDRGDGNIELMAKVAARVA